MNKKYIKLLDNSPDIGWEKGDIVELTGGIVDSIAYKLVSQGRAEFVKNKRQQFETQDLILAASLISYEFKYEIKLIGMQYGKTRYSAVFNYEEDLQDYIDRYNNGELKVNPRSYQMARNVIGKEMQSNEKKLN